MNFEVFLIDDDVVDVENVRRALRDNQSQLRLHTAHDGQQALDMLDSGEVGAKPTVILLDLNMPRMSGIEFLSEIRANPRHCRIPVVVLTTSDSERDKLDAYERNIAGYILKPVTYDAFVQTMEHVLAYWSLQEFPT